MSPDPDGTAELTELLQFLDDWLSAHHTPLDESLRAFTGAGPYGAWQLRADLNRFSFLLGGNDSAQLFGPPQQ
jgi:hypothetical protein